MSPFLHDVYEGKKRYKIQMGKKRQECREKKFAIHWRGSGISRESKGLDDKSANIEYPESFVFLLLRSSGGEREWHRASRCFTCLLRCRSSRGAARRLARARLYIKWCSRFTSQIESRAIGRFSISLNNGLCYTGPTFSRFALSLLLASSHGTLLSPSTFSHFSPGTYPSCFALLRFRFYNLTSLKVFTNKALEAKIFNFRDI